MSKWILSLAAVLVLSACSSSQKKAAIDNRLSILEKELSRQSEELRSLREKNLVIESLLASTAQRETPKEQKATLEKVPENPIKESIFSKQPSPVLVQTEEPKRKVVKEERLPKGEHHLYAKGIELYRKKEQAQLERVVRIFLKAYPQSVHADNASLLQARLSFETGQFKRALRQLGEIEKRFSFSNKMPSVLYLKALSYKKLGQKKKCLSLLRKVARRFPGSRESYKSKTEMKLLAQKGAS